MLRHPPTPIPNKMQQTINIIRKTVTLHSQNKVQTKRKNREHPVNKIPNIL